MEPLAQRMRPARLSEYTGQSHIVGEGAILRRAIESGKIPSLIFWGPPGVGKTTLANIIAKELGVTFFTLSAVTSGVKDVRDVIDKASRSDMFSDKRPLLFIDEIHRFSKSQQDSLLGAVEKGVITLIGATTENPSFEVISPLLSRCQVYILKSLGEAELVAIMERALKEDRYLASRNIELKEKAALLNLSDGDARRLLNNLELVVETLEKENNEKIVITDDAVLESLQQSMARYDKDGEQHYDIISAFIKSLRGSDPNAAVYWLARMIEGGEKPEFIARRMLILASEDIGNANPTALVVANACFDAVHKIGWPESRIILSQCAIYLASSPKSNASYMAINEAQAVVKNSGNLPVPLHIRNAPTKLMKDEGYAKGYRYAHDFEGNFALQEYLPDELSGRVFYQPGKNPREEELRVRLKKWWDKKYNY